MLLLKNANQAIKANKVTSSLLQSFKDHYMTRKGFISTGSSEIGHCQEILTTW